MGTSGPYKGQKGILPRKKDDDITWTVAKTFMSKYITSGGNVGTPKTVVKNYFKAANGSNSFLNQTKKIISVISDFNNILGSFIEQGLEKTFEELGISIVDKDINEAFSMLINVICPESSTKNDIALRLAIINTLDSLSNLDEGIEKILNNFDSSHVDLLIEIFISEIFWQNIMIDYGFSFEKYGEDTGQLVLREKEIQDYIYTVVSLEYDKNKQATLSEKNIAELYKKVLIIMED